MKLAAPHRIPLTGRAKGLTALDTIEFQAIDSTTTEVHYIADLRFGGILGVITPLMKPWLDRIGTKAVQGMKQALEPTDRLGLATACEMAMSAGQPMSAMLARAHRRILTGSTDGADHWSNRAEETLAGLCMGFGFLDAQGPTLLQREDETELWTFAGGHANQYLATALPPLGIPIRSTNGLRIRLDAAINTDEALSAIEAIADGQVIAPFDFDADHPMLKGLKFNEILPAELLEKAGRARLYGDEPTAPFQQKICCGRDLR